MKKFIYIAILMFLLVIPFCHAVTWETSLYGDEGEDSYKSGIDVFYKEFKGDYFANVTVNLVTLRTDELEIGYKIWDNTSIQSKEDFEALAKLSWTPEDYQTLSASVQPDSVKIYSKQILTNFLVKPKAKFGIAVNIYYMGEVVDKVGVYLYTGSFHYSKWNVTTGKYFNFDSNISTGISNRHLIPIGGYAKSQGWRFITDWTNASSKLSSGDQANMNLTGQFTYENESFSEFTQLYGTNISIVGVHLEWYYYNLATVPGGFLYYWFNKSTYGDSNWNYYHQSNTMNGEYTYRVTDLSFPIGTWNVTNFNNTQARIRLRVTAASGYYILCDMRTSFILSITGTVEDTALYTTIESDDGDDDTVKKYVSYLLNLDNLLSNWPTILSIVAASIPVIAVCIRKIKTALKEKETILNKLKRYTNN